MCRARTIGCICTVGIVLCAAALVPAATLHEPGSSAPSMMRSAAGSAEGCPGDLNDDDIVNVLDLLIVLDAWGPCPDPADCPADLNGDGVVNVVDLQIVLGGWGACDPDAPCPGLAACSFAYDNCSTTAPVGSGQPTVIMMLQRYETGAEATEITSIMTTFGSLAQSFACVQAGDDFGWVIYDGDSDGAPGEVLASGLDEVDGAAIDSDVRQTIHTPDVPVDGEFFIAVYLVDEGDECLNLPYDGTVTDQSEHVQLAAEAGATSVRDVDPSEINTWSQPPTTLQSVTVPPMNGVWFLAACTNKIE